MLSQLLLVQKDGEEGRYENLPEELIIPAGKNSVESEPVTMKKM